MSQTSDPSLPALPLSEAFKAASLSSRKPTRFDLIPSAQARAAVADYLGILAIKKMRFVGAISPKGRHDFALGAVLEAVVEQACAITLEPVVTTIREDVLRVYLAKWDYPTGDEVEIPDDDTTEALGEEVDIGHVAVEALSLALPPFPRAPGAILDVAEFSAPGTAPLRDADLKPFAGLAALKAKLENPDGGAE
ncbi:YceD family protein [Pseudorhodobacter ferrugineus]|uniref:YceD family protein n=1 Tax=Pseudorhodobacter ferrugineus TaxID=77008 RepID=UPI0003B7A81B|nr:DUF177 domain-containing protein [Pseudorhodobacter ferrugineus]